MLSGNLQADDRLQADNRLIADDQLLTDDWLLADEQPPTNDKTPADQTLTRETQESIINDYLWITGQTKHQAHPSSLGTEYDLPIKCGTPAIVRFMTNRDKLDHDLLQSLGVVEHARPDLDSYFDSPGGHFRIHYASSGIDTVYRASVDLNGNSVPDYIDSVAMVADSVWDIMVNQLGFPEPVTDTFCTTSDGPLFDIYVSALAANVYGMTWADYDCAIPGSFLMQVPGFIEIDNDYQHISIYRDRPMDAVRVTIAHEFFHAVQFGMDYTEFTGGTEGSGNLYWGEMSAVWMEEKIYDEINDYYYYLPYFFNNPNTSFQQFLPGGDNHPYASVVFPLFLSEKYGDSIIRVIWEKEVELGVGPNFLEAASFAIESMSDDTYVTAFSEFALWNFFTGFRSVFAPDTIGYEEGVEYPIFPDSLPVSIDSMIPNFAIYDSYPVPFTTANANPFKPEHNAISIIRFENTELVQEERFYRCVDSLTYYNPICNQDSTVAVEVTDSSDIANLAWDAMDSSFTIVAAIESMVFPVDDTAYVSAWTVSLVFQDLSHSIEIDRLYLPSFEDVYLPAYSLNVDRVNQYKRITMILAPASPYEELYQPGVGKRVGYVVRELMSGDTALTPIDAGYDVNQVKLVIYPNPAVVNQMQVTQNTDMPELRFRVANMDVSGDPFVGLPEVRIRTVLNMFDVAGNIVFSGDTTIARDLMGFFVEGSRALEGLAWDMTNQAGTPVASGVYIGIAEIYIDRRKVADAIGKVAIIR